MHLNRRELQFLEKCRVSLEVMATCGIKTPAPTAAPRVTRLRSGPVPRRTRCLPLGLRLLGCWDEELRPKVPRKYGVLCPWEVFFVDTYLGCLNGKCICVDVVKMYS